MIRPTTSRQQAPSGQALLAAVRAGFIIRGTTFSEWCRANGAKVQNARMAVLGGWTGPKAKALVSKIAKASGVKLLENA